MPRVASQTSTAQRERRAGSSVTSPRKQTKETQTAQTQDKSQWPASRLPVNKTISQSKAMKKYHITKKDLEDVQYTPGIVPVAFKKGVCMPMPIYRYKEREVEMKAWEKYGGPEGFQKMLNDKKAGKPVRKSATKKVASIPKPPTPEIIVLSDTESSTDTPSIEESVKAQMVSRGERWLWNALTEYLSGLPETSPGADDRTTLLQCALETLEDYYPKRPASDRPPKNSSSFAVLQCLLSEAPTGYVGPRIKSHLDESTGIMSKDWDDLYKKMVYNALDDVAKEHGYAALVQARWLAYDKYVSCDMGGLKYKSNHWYPAESPHKWMWYDTAKSWLEPR